MTIEKQDNLVALPALIDPHVHFRTPGGEHKEDWITGAKAAIAGGVTTVIDMPNNAPSITDHRSLINKQKIIEEQLQQINIPLKYYLYLGATADNWSEFAKCKDEIIGIKLFMDASTGNLLVDKLEDQEKIFKTCAELKLLLAVHAVTSTKRAIELAKKYHTKLYICHVSTNEEIDWIRQAKKDGLEVYAEATPHHLFLTENDQKRLGTLGKMNPPLRTTEDQKALWMAVLDGTIDTIGTDHAPHTLAEKAVPETQAPFGVPGIETSLPLLLNAYNEGKITLEKIVELTHTNPMKIFNLPETGDKVEVDLDLIKEIKNENLKTKCGWSPFNGWKLKGWPIKIINHNS